MQSGEFPAYDAEKVVLWHSVSAGSRILPAGHSLSYADCRDLQRLHISTVVGEKPADDDMPRNHAAQVLSGSVAGMETLRTPAENGEVYIHANTAGCLDVDRERTVRFNENNPFCHLSTRPPYTHVGAGDHIATLRCTPFHIPPESIQACIRLTSAGPLITVAPYRTRNAILLQVEESGDDPARQTALHKDLKNRLAEFSTEITATLRCEGLPDKLENGVREALNRAPDLLFVDMPAEIRPLSDSLPLVLERMGFPPFVGLPAEPGGALAVATTGKTAILGLSPHTPVGKGALDLLLRHLTARLPLDRKQIQEALGCGALYPRPPLSKAKERENLLQPERTEEGPRILTLIPAAGRGDRFKARHNKLLAPVAGKPLIEWTVDHAIEARLGPVLIVTGWEADALEEKLKDRDVRFVRNPHFEDGIMESLRVGVESAPADVEGICVLPGDMPGVFPEMLKRLAAAFDPDLDTLCLATVNGRRRNPTIWPYRFFKHLRMVPENAAYRPVFQGLSDFFREVPLSDPAAALDINTRGDLDSFHEILKEREAENPSN